MGEVEGGNGCVVGEVEGGIKREYMYILGETHDRLPNIYSYHRLSITLTLFKSVYENRTVSLFSPC